MAGVTTNCVPTLPRASQIQTPNVSNCGRDLSFCNVLKETQKNPIKTSRKQGEINKNKYKYRFLQTPAKKRCNQPTETLYYHIGNLCIVTICIMSISTVYERPSHERLASNGHTIVKQESVPYSDPPLSRFLPLTSHCSHISHKLWVVYC